MQYNFIEPLETHLANINELPAWCRVLEDEDWQFLKRFLLASGSLKEMARQYGVSYPTVRIRLDRLIAKVEAVESQPKGDAFSHYVAGLLAEGSVSKSVAKRLLAEHRKSVSKESSDG